MTVATKANKKAHLKIEFCVSVISQDGKIEVPLGFLLDDGKWHPYRFVEGGPEGCLELGKGDLADWIENPHSFGTGFLSQEEAMEAIEATIQRFRMVADAEPGESAS